jgi:hypothetical protein
MKIHKRLHVTQIPIRAQKAVDEAARLLATSKYHDPSMSAAAAIFLRVGAALFNDIRGVKLRRNFLEEWYPTDRRRRGRPKKVG